MSRQSIEETSDDGWAPLPDETRKALLQLEEYAGEVNAWNSGDDSNKPLADFAGKVYEVLHWYSAPDCRKNHPNWNPNAADTAGLAVETP